MSTAWESEAQTLRKRIDPKLAAQGWQVADFDASVPLASLNRKAVAEYPTDNGPADYALCLDGQVMGVVEAKKVTVGPQNVLTQAARYAQGVREDRAQYGEGFKAPFLYSTNGELIWFQDVRDPMNRSRKVKQFHTPGALRELLERDEAAAWQKLEGMPFRAGSVRAYQEDAVRAVELAKRQTLSVLARWVDEATVEKAL